MYKVEKRSAAPIDLTDEKQNGYGHITTHYVEEQDKRKKGQAKRVRKGKSTNTQQISSENPRTEKEKNKPTAYTIK